ncbi:SH3 domain-containing YSC84-like protein 1 isoform X1 [Acinonyx jubatus]|uniref:SH3 domain-containing YSC84-like protein 1 n=1 Tax=Acinonyx jubatus TaxID=32536 RepID=A0ABM3NCZ7_ACIJB|nr:SH3 domain-containing YSC84-like protein 1 isoform X1 [Acinonyx jubatus]
MWRVLRPGKSGVFTCPLPVSGVHLARRSPPREAGPSQGRSSSSWGGVGRSRGAGGPGSGVTMNNPIPSNLKSEAKKAAKILREFTEITSRNGPDKIIPAHVIAKAKGLAILSVIKAGFLVTARGGSGVVLARLPDGKWSAPSAIGIAGLGGGFEIGIEVSDLVIILNYDRAVEAFAKGGNLTLGGNFTVAVGPLGRNLEGNVALRSSAAVFTYCKSRGLFAGVSLEGSCLIERKETNRKFYCQDIRAYDILFGDMPRPAQAEDLYEILDSFTEKYENEGQRINARKAAKQQRKPAAKELPPKPLSRPQQSSAQVPLNSGSQSNGNKYKLYPELSSYQERVGNLNQPIEVTALYSFEGQQPGDLNFQAGDRIMVISKTDSHFDWWEGKLRGQTGIFPANYVTMN